MEWFPQQLQDGYRAFASKRLPIEQGRFQKLAERGQKPRIMIIGCCDSRVAPDLIFNAAPGELFVLRTVANLVPPVRSAHMCHATAAALEFAVLSLEVEHIVVLGHARCGGVQAALDEGEAALSKEDYIGKWIAFLRSIKADMPHDADVDTQCALERYAIDRSLRNLHGLSYIHEREQQKKLQLHGAWFDIATGDLYVFDRVSNTFKQLKPDAALKR